MSFQNLNFVIIFILLIEFPIRGHSQQPISFIELNPTSEYRLAASSNEAAFRVGNAMLVRVVALNKEGGAQASLVLAACSGLWVTLPIQTIYEFDGTPTFQYMFIKAKNEEDPIPMDSAPIIQTTESRLFFTKALTQRARALCKTASKEPRNVLFPVAESNEVDDMGTSVAIVLGTSSKNNQNIVIWSRTTFYKNVPILLKDGQPFEYNGQIQKKKEATGKYSLERRIFNCKERSMGTIEFAEYEQKGATPKTWSTKIDKVDLRSVIPNSVGEAQLEAVCALYSVD